ncbi:hypothetical protein CVS40_11670 [Lucilia cuprina]|nr:hypothetical protein CVS40_11670 [Lucilia cuprina]KAI8116224.1 hypothetical protein CVS40_11670 [Lucilia cuprina]
MFVRRLGTGFLENFSGTLGLFGVFKYPEIDDHLGVGQHVPIFGPLSIYFFTSTRFGHNSSMYIQDLFRQKSALKQVVI